MSMTGLTNENIDLAAAQAEDFLSECGLETKDRLRLRLTIEETLLKYQEALGRSGVFSIRCVKRLGRSRIELAFPGERVDPALSQEETDSEVLRGLWRGWARRQAGSTKTGSIWSALPRREKSPPRF